MATREKHEGRHPPALHGVSYVIPIDLLTVLLYRE